MPKTVRMQFVDAVIARIRTVHELRFDTYLHMDIDTRSGESDFAAFVRLDNAQITSFQSPFSLETVTVLIALIFRGSPTTAIARLDEVAGKIEQAIASDDAGRDDGTLGGVARFARVAGVATPEDQVSDASHVVVLTVTGEVERVTQNPFSREATL